METKEISLKVEPVEVIKCIQLYKDANDFLYFEEKNDPGMIQDHWGGVSGFVSISIEDKYVKCEKHSGFFEVYLRDKKRWLSYQGNNSENFEFYDEKIISSTESFLQLFVEQGRRNEYAIYLFNEDRFIPHFEDGTKLGLFDVCPDVTVFRKEKALFLSLHNEKRTAVYLIEKNEFVAIPYPLEDKKEKQINVFLFIFDAYAVLKFGYDSAPKFHIFDFETRQYKDLNRDHDNRLDEKYWKPQGVGCAAEYIACGFLPKSGKDTLKFEWEVFSIQTWERVTEKFETSLTTSFFSSVSVENGKMIISCEIKNTVSVTL